MKKLFKKLITLLLSVIICLGVVGCVQQPEGNDDINGKVESFVEANVADPNHSTFIKDTNNYLFVNGNSDYKIVIPALQQNEKYIAEAVKELNYFLSMSVGNTLPVVVDTQLTFDANSKYISLGNTTLLSQVGYKIEPMTSSDGYEIISKDLSVFIIGGGTSGVMYGVYKFLYHEIGFEAFAQDEIIFRTAKNVKLYEYDVREVPDIDVRHLFTAEYTRYASGLEFSHRVGVNGYEDYMLSIDGTMTHTSFVLVPPEKYKAEHENWYAPSGTQLCYTRDIPGMSKVVTDKIKQELLRDTTAKIVGITHEDAGGWCTCSECIRFKSKYGADSSTAINFASVCAKELNRWLSAPSGDENGCYTDAFNEIYGYQGPTDRKIQVMIYAYGATAAPPTNVDFDVPDNIAVQWAPISANFNYAMDHQANVSFKNTIETWAKVVKNIMFWSYSVQEVSVYIPINTLNAIQESYQYMKSINTTYIFQESAGGAFKMVDWTMLKSYVFAKLMWNVNANVPDLIDNFVYNYYGPAAEKMKAIFNDEQDFQVYQADILKRSGYGGMSTQGDAQFWPQAVLLKYSDMLDDAQKTLDDLWETDPIRAKLISERITLEEFPFRYLLLRNYKYFYSEADFEEMKAQLIADVAAIGAVEGVYEDARKRFENMLESL